MRRGFDVLAQFFVPAERIRERSRRDHVPYDEWARQGVLTATPGAVVDYEAIRRVLQQWAAEFARADDGVRPVERDRPGVAARAAGRARRASRCGRGSRRCRRRRSRSRRRFSGAGCGTTAHPVLRWNVSNVAVESDPAGNLKPSKTASTERIDGVVALIMAVDLMDRHAQTPSRRAIRCWWSDEARAGRPRLAADDDGSVGARRRSACRRSSTTDLQQPGRRRERLDRRRIWLRRISCTRINSPQKSTSRPTSCLLLAHRGPRLRAARDQSRRASAA